MQMYANIGRPYLGRHRLPFSVPPHLRVAQVMAGKLLDGVIPFPPNRWCDIERFKPHILIGPGSELLRLAEHMQKRGIEFPSLDRAVIVVTEIGEPPVDDVLRVVLWQTFAVPIYEIFIGPGNRMLGFECEAHEGWHMEPGVRFCLRDGELVVGSSGRKGIPTGLPAEIILARCPCGRSGPRVVCRRTQANTKRVPFSFAATA